MANHNQTPRTQNQQYMNRYAPYKVTIIAPTCFYYQAPLFRDLAAHDFIDLTVFFCSNEGVSGTDVKVAYGANETWGTDDGLLDGYRYKFLRNYSPHGTYLKSLVGLANFGIWNELKQERPDAVIVMSWMNPTWWLTFLACLRFKIPMLFLTDANVNAEQLKSSWKTWFKRIFLGKILFPLTTGFLCAGTANRELYAYYGVPPNKLVPFAYSWGYQSFAEESDNLQSKKAQLRQQIGVPQDATVILYCGRFSPEKGLNELLQAYNQVRSTKKALVLVGDGGLRRQMQNFVDYHQIESVYFMGFQNRKAMGKFYALADVFVLPSWRETWGMVVNEALCFSLPVIVSDQVGAGVDLVIPDANGHIFPAGDISELADRLSKIIELTDEDRITMGKKSRRLIQEWSNRNLGSPLQEFLDSVYDGLK